MRSSATLKWVGLALLGLLIAAGVSIAASRLASQQIGLASEPISAGDALAPAAQQQGTQPGQHRHGGGPAAAPTVTTPQTTMTTAPQPTPTTTETVAPEPQPEEPGRSGSGDGEHGGGRGGGGHADD